MKEVFRQYGGVLIAAAATSAFLVLMGNIVLAQGGMLAQLINIWGSSAIPTTTATIMAPYVCIISFIYSLPII